MISKAKKRKKEKHTRPETQIICVSGLVDVVVVIFGGR
jgi:Flp pilus assembly protein TadB